jgi:hypothetical protein
VLSMKVRVNSYENAKAQAFFKRAEETACFPVDQVFGINNEGRGEILEYIEVY